MRSEDLNIDHIDQIMSLMHKWGISRIKLDGLEVETRPPRSAVIVDAGQPPLTEEIGAANGNPTEEELLYLSTNYHPEVSSRPPEEP